MSTMPRTDADVSHPKSIRNMVGRRHQVSFTYEVGREKIREFAQAVQDDHLAHVDDAAGCELGYGGVIAPITFVSVFGTAILPELFAHLLIGYGIGDILHSDQQMVLHGPLRVGDVLSSDLCLESFRQAGGSDIMVTVNDVTDAYGTPIVTTRTTFVARTGGHDNAARFGERLNGVMRREA